MTTPKKPSALIDLDGTLADFHGAMERDLRKLLAPGEEPLLSHHHEEQYPHVKARRDMIKRQPDWWFNLEKLDNGFRIVELLRLVGFRLTILTRGPKKLPMAWEQKARWSLLHVPDARITVTSAEKAAQYGRVLVDDWPDYIKPWVKVRPRGLVVMPNQPWNRDFNHPQVFRYSGIQDDGKLLELLQFQKTRK